MGNNRNLFVLIALVVVVGVIYGVASHRRPSLDTTGGFVDLVEGTLSSDDVYSVRFALADADSQSIQMVQTADGWVMPDFHEAPANLNKIRTLLGNLEATHGEFRSDDASVLDAYALEDSTAYRLTLRDEGGEAVVDILVGKRSGSGCFARRVGETAVYALDHNFLSDFGIWGDERKAPDRNSWLDLVAYKVDRDEVSGFEIHGDGAMVALEKEFVATDDSTSAASKEDSYEWRVTEPRNFLATRTRAEAILSAIVSLRARDVVGRGDPGEEMGLGDDAWSFVVRKDDGTTETLRFGAELPDEPGQVYLQVEGRPLIWSVPTYVRDNLFKSVDDLKDE